ncbi:baseplate J/gp47 family protein [Acidocella sp. KAb 2-4]|uniref:baseplate J/gp47 family protein n=1 Tax=Acidocella sp. KAb 2-4 TaxID=2885158 RepID=UPI001D088C8F|nr:baseplate J/gp47 family protein [Acidocella sp. KAb 2-4]MCB5944112.1 baseplate J/gp47 family protein [Acidocella sp. KAb 2-4]
MKLTLQNFSTLVEGMAAAVQGAAASLLDLTVGSVLRAILEANASVALWLQWLIVQVLATTRLATSTGADCDSFGADFGFTRLPAVAASGQVTFSRFTPSVAALVPVGTQVSAVGNGQGFVVVADAGNAAYSAANNGYQLAAGIASVTATVAALVPGSAGNVQPDAISVVNSAIAGVDVVSNALALTGGMDAESDAAFRARFGNYLASLSRATAQAIGSAIAAIQQGLSFVITENINQAGATQMGHFVVTVDDGTGNPPASLLATVQQAVNAVRPVGSSFAVQGPVVVPANVALTLVTANSAVHAAAIARVAAALENYIAALPVGATLSYTRLAQLAYDASGAVTNISTLLLNGGAVDLVPPLFGAVRAGTVTVA